MNTILEDIAVEIGFTATMKLVIWFGGRRATIYVPEQAREGQVLASVIGLPAAARLSKRWPKKYLNVPTMMAFEVELRRQEVHRLLSGGATLEETAASVGITPRRVDQIRAELRRDGLLSDQPASSGPPVMVLSPEPHLGQHDLLRDALAARRSSNLNGRPSPPRGRMKQARN